MPRIIPRPDLPKLRGAWEAKGLPYAIIYEIMLQAGLRISEACILKWGDLIWIDKPVSAIRLHPQMTKGNRERLVPVTSPLADNLTLAFQCTIREQSIDHQDFVAAQTHNAPALSSRSFQRALHAIALASVGYHVNPHMLRHTFATELLRVTSLPVVQQALGHRRISTTAIYTHPSINVVSEGMNRMYQT